MTTLVPAPLRTLFDRRDPIVRMLALVGLALAASGLLHVLVWAAMGAPSLSGPVTWRKPIVFGLSGGVTTLSLAWLASLLGPTAWRRRLGVTYAVTITLEVLLIDLQQWRGVGSHFNVTAPIDGAIFGAMGLLIVTAAMAVVGLGVILWRTRDVAQDARAAGLAALLLMQGAVLVGFAMIGHGSAVAATHQGMPAVVAGHGLLKLPHGIALHGLQILPLLAWLLARVGVGVAERVRLVIRTAWGLGLVAAGALIGAVAGREPLDPPLLAVAVAALGGALLIMVFLRLVAAWWTRTPTAISVERT